MRIKEPILNFVCVQFFFQKAASSRGSTKTLQTFGFLLDIFNQLSS